MSSIDKLEKRVESNREQRARDATLGAEYRERMKLIQETPDHLPMGFWCTTCESDFEGMGHKCDDLYGYDLDSGKLYATGTPRPRAWYAGICPEGHRAIRRITDKLTDPYYWQSEVLKRQRVQMADDLVQPDDPRFAKLYPEQWRKMNEEGINV